MAAKQGLTAQIHQYSEDTKRSLLSRAPAGIKSHSWLSNLNTTCTIKSAPPRTPEVMSMLSSKCGWLVKRNEQHVWQKRWCCVVPHTFLYYFEASPEVKTEDNDGTHEVWSGGGINLNAAAVVVPFQNVDQEALNAAVKDGYEDVDHHGGARMSLYPSLPNIMGGGNAAGDPHDDHGVMSGGVVEWDPDATPMNKGEYSNGTYQFASSNLQPVGIIDLECYSVVNRSKLNPTVLELAGDSITNPDLRSFYFQSATVDDAECWTKALLTERHQSLKDETEAYRQVCESFPLQLSNFSEMINEAEAKAESMEKEAYAVRCSAEEGRRKVVAAVREMLERKCWETEGSKRDGDLFGDTLGGVPSDEKKVTSDVEKSLLDSVLDSHFEKLETNRAAFLRELEAALASPTSVATSNVLPPVQSLVDYTSAIVASFGDLRTQLQKYEMDLVQSVKQDQTQLEALKGDIQGRDEKLADAQKEHDRITSELEAELEASRREMEQLSKQLEAQRMEFGMYQNATKTKLSELQQHKKILKKEVIEMRKKIDESESESTSVAHEYGKVKSKYQSQKEKNVMLARYIDRLEKQVGVQQNMMEMMSQTGGASFVGKMVGPGANDDSSKDGISLSGLSKGSYRREASNVSSSASATPMSRRPLLPRTTSKSVSMFDVSPLPVPPSERKTLEKDQDASNGDDATGEDRNPPTVGYQSETATEAESPTDPAEESDTKPAPQTAQEPSDTANNGPTISTRAEEKLKTPERKTKTPKAESPVQITNLPAHDIQTPIRGASPQSAQNKLEIEPEANIVSLNESLLEKADAPAMDDDDDASRVSDITEDRTQRLLDDDLAERRRILLAYVNNQSTNPSNTLTTERRLETIESMIPDVESQKSGSTRLSVAQRARLAANNRANDHRSPNPSVERRKEMSSSSSVQSVGSGKSASDRSRSSVSFISRLGKRLETAIDNSALGIGPRASESLESNDSDNENENEDSNTNDDDDRTSEIASEVSSTLQDRMALQRERQVAFLKKKQLLEDESKLKGGAGLGATPPSKNTSTPTRTRQLKDRLGRVLSAKDMKAPLSPVSSVGAPSSVGVPQGEL
ncbi:hypothetical protein ACHAWT_009897 [Skeletonema menzelii]